MDNGIGCRCLGAFGKKANMGLLDRLMFPTAVPKWGAFFTAAVLSFLSFEDTPTMTVYHTNNLHAEYDYVIGE